MMHTIVPSIAKGHLRSGTRPRPSYMGKPMAMAEYLISEKMREIFPGKVEGNMRKIHLAATLRTTDPANPLDMRPVVLFAQESSKEDPSANWPENAPTIVSDPRGWEALGEIITGDILRQAAGPEDDAPESMSDLRFEDDAEYVCGLLKGLGCYASIIRMFPETGTFTIDSHAHFPDKNPVGIMYWTREAAERHAGRPVGMDFMKHNAETYFKNWANCIAGDTWDLYACIPGIGAEFLGQGTTREIMGNKMVLKPVMSGLYVDLSEVSIMDDDAVEAHKMAMADAEAKASPERMGG